jgi:hypothetical protein
MLALPDGITADVPVGAPGVDDLGELLERP